MMSTFSQLMFWRVSVRLSSVCRITSTSPITLSLSSSLLGIGRLPVMSVFENFIVRVIRYGTLMPDLKTFSKLAAESRSSREVAVSFFSLTLSSARQLPQLQFRTNRMKLCSVWMYSLSSSILSSSWNQYSNNLLTSSKALRCCSSAVMNSTSKANKLQMKRRACKVIVFATSQSSKLGICFSTFTTPRSSRDISSIGRCLPSFLEVGPSSTRLS
mmetsp:Transcript_107426/g.256692  ORF Transcript_107426/g.256692 Transcript_107426/m.256692 type:complete len:215 (-) Transcript_107426:1463-2107(-)